MQISRSTLQKALFKAYRIAVSPEANTVTAHDLQDAWPSTGLRRNDFTAALDELARRKWLTVSDQGLNQMIELTPAGVHALHESENGWSQDLLDWVILKRAELRQIKSHTPQARIRQRRSSESDRVTR